VIDADHDPTDRNARFDEEIAAFARLPKERQREVLAITRAVTDAREPPSDPDAIQDEVDRMGAVEFLAQLPEEKREEMLADYAETERLEVEARKPRKLSWDERGAHLSKAMVGLVKAGAFGVLAFVLWMFAGIPEGIVGKSIAWTFVALAGLACLAGFVEFLVGVIQGLGGRAIPD
jgi:hypothetical protein